MNYKIKKGLTKAYKTIQKYSAPSTYKPFYPLPTGKSEMDYQQELLSQNEEGWESFKNSK